MRKNMKQFNKQDLNRKINVEMLWLKHTNINKIKFILADWNFNGSLIGIRAKYKDLKSQSH